MQKVCFLFLLTKREGKNIMERELTCIVCPMGCKLKAEISDGKVISVTGNTCPRGEKYAQSEITNPMRVITTTVRTEDGRILSVKTAGEVAKDKVFNYMKEINALHPDTDRCNIGDIIHTLDNGVNVVVTSAHIQE